MTNFDGRLFGGRLFAGQLFRARRRPLPPTGGDDMPSDARRRTDYTDNELIDMALAIIMSGALDG